MRKGIQYLLQPKEIVRGFTNFFLKCEIFEISNIHTKSKNFKITTLDFPPQRQNGKEIAVALFENKSNYQRILTLDLQAGNYFHAITITQSAE